MIQDIESFLRAHYPFSALPDSSLGALAFNIIVRYYPAGETIFEEGSKPLEYLYIVRKGAVSLEIGGREIDFLHEGDVFGYPSLLSGESPTVTARSLRDTILYLLPKELFLKLIEKYEEFELFFAKNLARKLSATVKLIRNLPGTLSTADKFFTLKIRDLKPRKVPLVEGKLSVLEGARIMRDKGLSCLLVREKETTGIVTERDIIKRVVAEGIEPSGVPLAKVMSYPLFTVEGEDLLFEAIVLMASKNVRRVAVVDDGRIIGVIEDKDIIAHESKNLIVLVKEVEKAQTIEELRHVYLLVDEMVKTLFAQGLKVEYISRLISEVNDRIIARAVLFTIRELLLEPPVAFSVMVLGSEGRREQTLKTDQDNALLYDDTYPMLDVDVEDYFRNFGERFTQKLLEIGFPPCPGNVMTRNREWRMGISEWKERIKKWVLQPEPENTLRLGIFFDFRNAFGDTELAENLRDFIFSLVEQQELFVAYMLMDAVRFKPPIGFMKRFILEQEGEHRGELDIKKGGIFPITQGARALSLKGKIRDTSTLRRLEKLSQEGLIPEDMVNDLREAYTFLQTLRLKVQIEKLQEGKPPDNYVNPQALTKLERDLLKDSFKIITEFQSFIERRYLTYIPQ